MRNLRYLQDAPFLKELTKQINSLENTYASEMARHKQKLSDLSVSLSNYKQN